MSSLEQPFRGVTQLPTPLALGLLHTLPQPTHLHQMNIKASPEVFGKESEHLLYIKCELDTPQFTFPFTYKSEGGITLRQD